MTKLIEKIDGYWFSATDRLPRDGRKIIVGKSHRQSGKIVICQNGFHFSRDPYDAFAYATGSYLHKVKVWGDVVEETDKACGRNRTYVARVDATKMLRLFARRQALSVIHLWEAPQVVIDYLNTGDENLRNAAARRAAYADARSAAVAAARRAAYADTAYAYADAAAADTAYVYADARSAAASAAAAADAAAYADAYAAAYAAADAAAAACSADARRAAYADARSAAAAAARQMFNEMITELFAS